MTASPGSVPVLEVGGTHVSAALVEAETWSVLTATRLDLDGDASADAIVDRFVAAARSLGPVAAPLWGVAMPDPFDYVHGVGDFAGVGKFAALSGVPVGQLLQSALGVQVGFLNDADAFALGEWVLCAEPRPARLVGVTLGTGVGSGWLADGAVTDPGVPVGGRIHTVTVDGRPLEDVVSRRALVAAWRAVGGSAGDDVRELAVAARSGDIRAADVVDTAMTVLGSSLGPLLAAFGAQVLVVGGSMSASWDVFGPAFEAALTCPVTVRVSAAPDDSPLIGAAVHAARQRAG